jgi:hypothetical protein
MTSTIGSTPAYEFLPPVFRQFVDLVVEEGASESWGVRAAMLERMCEWFRATRAAPASFWTAPRVGVLHAALIERLGTPPVGDGAQAIFYELSTSAEHCAAARRWFDEHAAPQLFP